MRARWQRLDSPKVALHDPMQGHKERLPQCTDRDIHNVTAFLYGAAGAKKLPRNQPA